MLIAKMKRGYYERRMELRHLRFAFKFAFQMVFYEILKNNKLIFIYFYINFNTLVLKLILKK
jgi:hypothetical protein